MRTLTLAALALATACTTGTTPDCDPATETCGTTDSTSTDTGDDTSTPEDSADTGDSGTPVVFDSCDDLGLSTVDLTAAGADAAGRYVAFGRFEAGNGDLAPSCAPGRGPEAIATFTVPTTGAWHLTTDGPGTGSETTLSLRTACDDRAELACDARGAGRYGATLVTEATAGDELVVVVDGIPGARGWQLTATPVTGEAGEGETCSPFTPCETGFTCAGEAPATTCIAYAAPEVTSHTFGWTTRDFVAHRFEGTDADMDVEHLWLLGAVAEDGEVYGDDPGEDPIELRFTSLTQRDGAFVATSDLFVNGFAYFVSPIVEITYGLEDERGHRTVLDAVDIPLRPEQATAALGEACDLTGFPTSCASGSTCQADGAGATCQTPVAPVLDGVEILFAQDDDITLRFTGSDADLDARGVKIQAVQVDGTRPRVITSYFNDAGTTWTGTSFVADRSLSIYVANGPIDSLEITLFDRANNEAPMTTVDWVDVPVQVLAADAACVPDSEVGVCDEGLMCSPVITGGTTCQAPSAPVLYSATFEVDPVTTWLMVTVDGWDLNGDLDNVIFMFSGPYGRYPEAFRWNRMVPSPKGQQFFLSTGPLEDVPLSALTHVDVFLQDEADLESNVLTVPLVGVGQVGDLCDRESTGFVCDPAGGLTCGVGGTCEVNEAPEVTGLVARRLNDTDVRIEVSFSDANADAWDGVVTVHRDGVTTDVIPRYTLFDSEIYGLTSGTTELTLLNWARDTTEMSVDVAVRDLPGLYGTPMTVVVPPIVDVGGTCSGDDTVDRCTDGSSCDEGVCVEHAPTLDSVELTFEDHGRTAVFTMTGSEADGDLDRVLLEGSDGLGGTWTHDAVPGRSYGDQVTVTWDGTDFTAVVRALGWGDAETGGLIEVTATLEDARDDASAPLTVDVPTTSNLDEVCDDSGIDSRCQAGLTCDEGACVTDTTDACAGIDLDDLATAASEIDGDLVASFDLTGLTGLAEPNCASNFSFARGGEHAFVWTAPRDGTITAQTSVGQGDVGVWIHLGQCVDPGEHLDCGQYGNAAEAEVFEGDTLYFVLDAFYSTDPRGTLTVGYVD